MAVEENETIDLYNLVDSQVDTGRFPWMDIILRRWAHLLETTLFEKLGVMFETEALPVEWMRFDQFCAGITGRQPLYIFETQANGQGILAVSNKFAHACINQNAKARLQDQSGELPDLDSKSHQKLHLMLQHILKDFEKSWSGIAELKVMLKKVTSHRFRAKIMVPYEKCIVAKIVFHGHGFSSDLALCFPYLSFDSVFQKQGRKKILPPESLDHFYAETREHFRTMLEEVEYEIVAELGTVAVNEQTPIRVGGILPLASSVGREMTLKINETPVLAGEMGQAEENYAVRIIGNFEEKKEKHRKRPRAFNKIKWPQA
ncbi:MAG: FliM/FliN family flagellar motor switch protein [SAR324 cluster bacterium]|nr:FliM/FliN family flagellar motor switch protein [SAR324 cluster bacterium]